MTKKNIHILMQSEKYTTILKMMAIGMIILSLWGCRRVDARMYENCLEETSLIDSPSTSSASITTLSQRAQSNRETLLIDLELAKGVKDIIKDLIAEIEASSMRPPNRFSIPKKVLIVGISGLGLTLTLGGIWRYLPNYLPNFLSNLAEMEPTGMESLSLGTSTNFNISKCDFLRRVAPAAEKKYRATLGYPNNYNSCNVADTSFLGQYVLSKVISLDTLEVCYNYIQSILPDFNMTKCDFVRLLAPEAMEERYRTYVFKWSNRSYYTSSCSTENSTFVATVSRPIQEIIFKVLEVCYRYGYQPIMESIQSIGNTTTMPSSDESFISGYSAAAIGATILGLGAIGVVGGRLIYNYLKNPNTQLLQQVNAQLQVIEKAALLTQIEKGRDKNVEEALLYLFETMKSLAKENQLLFPTYHVRVLMEKLSELLIKIDQARSQCQPALPAYKALMLNSCFLSVQDTLNYLSQNQAEATV